MGRLTKKKIDQIAKLRGEGYTQIEVAERTGVCLKTVRKYDPGGTAGSAREWRELQSLPERVSKLERIIETLSAWTFSYQLGKGDENFVFCPKCERAVVVTQTKDKRTKKSHYECPDCGRVIQYAKHLYGPLADIFGEEKQ